MTSPQDPWQQDQSQQNYPQQGYPQNPQQPGHPQQGTPSGGFPQQGYQQPGYPQQGYPQPGYPQYPPPGYPQGNPYAAPPAPEHDTAALSRPATINAAFWIAVVVPLLATVLIVVNTFLQQEAIRSSISASDPEVRELAGTAALVGIGFVVFFFAVLSGLWILFGFKMRAGRNWARITLTVFASLWLLVSVLNLLGATSMGMTYGSGDVPAPPDPSGGMVALSYTQAGLGLVAMAAFLVLVYLKPSNWFFQAARHR